MLLIPFDTVTLISSRSYEEVLAILRDSCSNPVFGPFTTTSDEPIRVQAKKARFRFVRTRNGRRSFAPVYCAHVVETDSLVRIHLRMRLSIASMTSLCAVMFILLGAVVNMLWRGKGLSVADLLMMTLFYTLCMWSFLSDRRRGLDRLKELLDAEVLPFPWSDTSPHR